MGDLGDVVFSIIVPTKNEEKQISECLEEIFKQDTTLPFEVILVDSSSTKETHTIGDSFGAKVIFESRLGKGIACNTGANNARGSILCFTEADCRVPKHWLSAIYSELSNDPKHIAVVGDYDYHDASWFYNFLLNISMPVSVWLYYLIFNNHSLRCTNFAVKAHAYRQAGGISLNAKEFQDVELGLRLRKFGKINFSSSIKITTSARRVQGRIFKYLIELIPALFKLLILKQVPDKATYEDIR